MSSSEVTMGIKLEILRHGRKLVGSYLTEPLIVMSVSSDTFQPESYDSRTVSFTVSPRD